MPVNTDFVPADVDFRDWKSIQPLFRQLLERPLEDPADVERWLLERSDLQAHVQDAAARLHVEMTCHTDDPARQEAYRAFQRDVIPNVKKAEFELDRKYVEAPARAGLEDDRHFVINRRAEADVALFREANVAIEFELSELAQEHRRLTGAQTVEFDGRERTPPEMRRYLEDPRRDVRERAWLAVEDRRMRDRDALRAVFDAMLDKRQRIAENAGFENFRDYQFRRMHRFDYTPRDCEDFHQTIEDEVVPLARRLGRRRAEAMGLDRYRPWDTVVDVHGRGPLAPFENVDEMVEGAQRVFDRMDSELGRMFSTLRGKDSLDLATRRGKSPGGYQTTFTVDRRPFIFMNAAGLGRDFRTLLHEAGHAFHTLRCQDEPLLAYRRSPIEFAEVASMTMEFTALPWLDQVYADDADRQRAVRIQLEHVPFLLPWIARIDAFQQWLYTNPGHSHEDRAKQWMELESRFGLGIDWTGIEPYAVESWQQQLHLFQYPFYYIEYGIAQLGALQIWSLYQDSPEEALNGYKRALALGGSRPLPELFAAAGIAFDFGPKIVSELIESVEKQLDALPL